jgi:glycosyltransferase involved in cell wall biosynthesis
VTRRRILQVLGGSAGGIGRHVAEIVTAFSDDDDVVLDVAAPADLRAPMPVQPIAVPIPEGPVRGHVRAVRRLRTLIRDYDLVHAHGLRAGLDTAVAARTVRVRCIVTLHNLVRDDIAGGAKGRIYRRAEPLVVRLADLTFVPSRAMAEHLRALGARGRIEVLYAGTAPPPEPMRTRAEVRSELEVADHLVVTVARLHPQKALHVMLEAVAKMQSDAVLALVGEGPLEDELKHRAVELGIDDRVRWLGYRADAADYMAAADVFCLSSVWEAVPLAIQEAVALGVPVVSTDAGGVSELIEDGVSGRLVAPNDAGALAAALDEVLGAPDIARNYAESARRHLDANFSRGAILARLAQVYRG